MHLPMYPTVVTISIHIGSESVKLVSVKSGVCGTLVYSSKDCIYSVVNILCFAWRYNLPLGYLRYGERGSLSMKQDACDVDLMSMY